MSRFLTSLFLDVGLLAQPSGSNAAAVDQNGAVINQETNAATTTQSD